MKPVTIIVPVYNGYEDVKLCLESILRHTDLAKNRVLLVNDKSPDARMLPLLKSYVRDHIELVDSPVNEGFSASINKGIAASDTDVILLNSDTIVTENWVEKLAACAYHDAETGTVTPLSNSATLCSVPVMCQDNPVPENVTIDEYAEIIERCSLRAYPRISVAVGFCMYIKREVLDLVGAFDAATFGRGYGEENDFCNRAEQYGYKHVMCDDTFIYHKGTVSFLTEEKQHLIEEHDAILRARYPKQMENNHLYCIHNPEQYIRDNINLYTALANGRKNVLYLIHADFREDAYGHAGGTQFHVHDLVTGLRNDCNIFVAARDRTYLRVTIYCGEKEFSFRYEIGEETAYPLYTNQRLKHIFDQILNAFHIDLVHIHQTSGLSLDLYTCAQEKKIPVVATIHDYYYICPTIKLVDEKNRFCAGHCADGEAACRSCLMAHEQVAPQVDFLKRWRQENERALSSCAAIVTPSESAKQVLLQTFPSLAEKISVILHGSDPTECETEVQIGEIVHSDDVRVNFDYAFDFLRSPSMIVGWAYKDKVNNDRVRIYVEIGDARGQTHYFAASKQARTDVQQLTGSQMYLSSGFSVSVQRQQFVEGPLTIRVILEENGVFYSGGETRTVENTVGAPAACKLRVAFLDGMVPEKGSALVHALITQGPKEIQWYLFGTLVDDRLAGLSQDNVTKIGTYERDSIYKLLRDYGIDLVCILPIWAETFCYTLSEAWLSRIPVLVTDIGAVGERVRAQGGGVVVPVSATTEEVLAEISRLADDPAALSELKAQARAVRVRTVAEMVADYRALYERLAVTEPIYGAFNAKEVYEASIGAGAEKSFYESETERLLQETARQKRELEQQQRILADEQRISAEQQRILLDKQQSLAEQKSRITQLTEQTARLAEQAAQLAEQNAQLTEQNAQLAQTVAEQQRAAAEFQSSRAYKVVSGISRSLEPLKKIGKKESGRGEK